MARDDIKAVVIAYDAPTLPVFTTTTANTTHRLPILVQPGVIKKALSAGKHVLSEKPIAPDLASATELIKWYHSQIPPSVNWSVAENFRFLEAYRYARSKIESLGRILGFSVEVCTLVHPGGKYYETEWRKVPSYQGGFLLDGGVHFTAGLQVLLGEEDAVERVAAFSTKNQEHLPPVDTVNAILKTKKGTTGGLIISFGTTFSNFEYSVACEGGVVTLGRGGVVVKRVGEETEEKKEFPDDKNGVGQEIQAFATAIIKGEPDERQAPELGYKDLELVSLYSPIGSMDV